MIRFLFGLFSIAEINYGPRCTFNPPFLVIDDNKNKVSVLTQNLDNSSKNEKKTPPEFVH
jgi:hypothetical protein